MKKLRTFLLTCATLFACQFTTAQAFDDGKNLVSVGFGFPPTSRITESFSGYQNDQNYFYKNYGTVVLKYEHGLMKYFGVGLNLEYSAASVSYQYHDVGVFVPDTTYNVTIKNSVLGGYVRLNGHYPVGDKLDLFAGVGLGYLYTTDIYTDNNPYRTNKNTKSLVFDAQFTLGMRYMIKDHFGLFLELGSASTTVQMGITFGF